MASPSPAAPLAPEWLAHRYDPGGDAIHFVEVGRDRRRASPFLTDEYLGDLGRPLAVPRAEALARTDQAAPIHFIFHSAYCCSTLLANALDRPGAASAFKEPVILNDLVGWRHRGAPPERLGEVLGDALTLLARPFEPGEAAVVKPSNLLNALAPAMLSLRPRAGCVLLSAPLRLFLGSIAGKGLWGRLWVRDLLVKQIRDGIVDGLGFEAKDHMLHSDLQVAAVGWLAQHRLFAQLAARWPDRVRTLDSETLLARPGDAVAAAAALFGLSLDAAAIGEIVAGDAFTRNAKDGARFTREDRGANQRAQAEAHFDEIEKVAVWAEAVADAAGVAFALPAQLLR